jgi:hypothetical protein
MRALFNRSYSSMRAAIFFRLAARYCRQWADFYKKMLKKAGVALFRASSAKNFQTQSNGIDIALALPCQREAAATAVGWRYGLRTARRLSAAIVYAKFAVDSVGLR